MKKKLKIIINSSLIIIIGITGIQGIGLTTNASIDAIESEVLSERDLMRINDINKYCAYEFTPQYNKEINQPMGADEKPTTTYVNSDEALALQEECRDLKTSTVMFLLPGEYEPMTTLMSGYTSTLELINEDDVVTVTVNGEVITLDKDHPIYNVFIRYDDHVMIESTNEKGIYYRCNETNVKVYDADGVYRMGYSHSN